LIPEPAPGRYVLWDTEGLKVTRVDRRSMKVVCSTPCPMS